MNWAGGYPSDGGVSRSPGEVAGPAGLFSVSRLWNDRGGYRVGFILKPDKSEAGVLLEALVPWLREQGHVPVVTSEDQISPAGCEVVPEDELGAVIDLA